MCRECRETKCKKADCNLSKMDGYRFCKLHVTRCRRCNEPRKTRGICSECYSKECVVSGCVNDRGKKSRKCATHSPCFVKGCTESSMSRRKMCLTHALVCTICSSPKKSEGLKCDICKRLEVYKVEDPILSIKILEGIKEQTLKCEICSVVFECVSDIRLDHDHLDGPGKIRGMLCNGCNTFLTVNFQDVKQMGSVFKYLLTTNRDSVIDIKNVLDIICPSD